MACPKVHWPGTPPYKTADRALMAGLCYCSSLIKWLKGHMRQEVGSRHRGTCRSDLGASVHDISSSAYSLPARLPGF